MIPLFIIFLFGLMVTIFIVAHDLKDVEVDEAEEVSRLMTQLQDAARVECQVFNPATGEWEFEHHGGDVWDMWAGGYEGGER